MANEEVKKKSLLEILNETLQWFIFGGLLFKKGGGPPTMPDGKPDIEIPRVPSWIVSKFHFLTTEDEQEYDQVMDKANPNISEQMKFFKFKNKLVDDGYDEDYLRLMLINLFRDSLNRKDAKKTEVPDSAVEFIKQIIALDGKYKRQLELAREKKFLKKTGPMKKLFVLAHAHKIKTLVVLAIAPFFLLAVFYQILNLIFG